jgi:DNA polymerase-3 subunit delta
MIRRGRETYGKRLSPDAAAALYELVGEALGTLDSELSKLAAYVGSREEVSADDVESVTGRVRTEVVFQVTDAMADGNLKLALELWQQVITSDRSAAVRAIGGLSWGVRRLLDAHRALKSGASLQELAPRQFVSPDLLKRRLERFSPQRLIEQQRDLLAADQAVKTGLATCESAVERYIVKHGAVQSTGKRENRPG